MLALVVMRGPALAEDSVCNAKRPVFSASGKLESLPRRLRRIEPIRILAIGSSSTEGIGASAPALSYPAQLQLDLARIWKRRVLVENAGRGGETIGETIKRLEAILKTSKPDLVIWQVGTNDAIRGDDERRFVSLLEHGIHVAVAAQIDLVLLDQQYYPGIPDVGRYERFVQLVGAMAIREKVPIFSRYKLMKDWAERSADTLDSMLSADRFHMGDRGYDCIAQLLALGIHAAVASRDAASGLASIAKTGR